MKIIGDFDSVTYAVAFACQDTTYSVFDEELGMPVAECGTKKEAKEQAEVIGPECTVEELHHPVSLPIALSETDRYVEKILDGVNQYVESTDYQLYLTASGLEKNFRYEIDPEYKANRKEFVKPYYYDTIRKHLVRKWGAEVVEGYEADDQLAIEGWQFWYRMKEAVDLTYLYESDQFVNDLGHTPVLCSIDKDLDTVPGWRYSWQTHNKAEAFYFLTEEEARRNFWIQVLTGDTSDGIIGLHRIGPKRAEVQLQHCATDKDYYEKCRTLYEAHDRLEDLDKNCALLYLLRSEDDSFEKFKESFLGEKP